MKKKLLILSASIGLLLACFPFTLFAEEDPQSDLGVSPPPAYYQLDEYFYDNFIAYPYLESDGTQYIDTGIVPKDNLYINLQFSNFVYNASGQYLYGGMDASNPLSNSLAFSISQDSNNDRLYYRFNTGNYQYNANLSDMAIYNVVQDNNICYLNGVNVHEFTEADFSGSKSISLFSRHAGNSFDQKSSFRLYSFSIYDYDQEEYVRYFYPAKSKSSEVLGLYDAVSKTFYPSLSSSPFAEPSGNIAEAGIVANIGNFIYYGLGWIGDILDFAIAEPVIILFMAIGLAGAMFRWGRRLVHF